MPLTMHQACVPPMTRTLRALSAMLDKAAAHAQARGVDQTALLDARLTPDMFPLARQVQIACDFAKGAATRLAGAEVPRFEDSERSFAELKVRIAKTLDILAAVDPVGVDGSEARSITLPIAGQPMTFTGQDYLLNFALPNFYFHVTTAYALMRREGVDIGKRDYIGPM